MCYQLCVKKKDTPWLIYKGFTVYFFLLTDDNIENIKGSLKKFGCRLLPI